MRLLHTADWHLGQSFHGFERTAEHAAFLAWLLETLERERPDALLVAGDVFDHANPPASAQQQLYGFLAAAHERLPRLQTVLTAGNHDSAARLEAPAAVLAALGVTVVGTAGRGEALDRCLVPLRDAAGEVAAWCLAVPFLRPADVVSFCPETTADHRFAAGVAALYQEVLARALARRTPGQALVALGHCHLRGGEASEESERNLVVGGAEALAPELFGPPLAYTGLGHLHRPQRVARREDLRYSGSPLPLSFSESTYRHQVLLVELDGAELAAVRPLVVPRTVPLLTVPDHPAPLGEVLAALAALDLPAVPAQLAPYLRVQVALDAPDSTLRAQIEAALEGQPVRLARIAVTRHNTGLVGGSAPLSLDEVARLGPREVFHRLLAERFAGEPPAELLAAFHELLDEVREAEGA